MANTDVVLTNSKGVLVPSADSVRVVSGDTITFATKDGRAAFVFFSPHAESILSPKPSNPSPIAAGAKARFTFTSSHPGAYSAFFGDDADDAPPVFPQAVSELLALETNSSDGPGFGGPGDSLGTGHGG